MKHLIAPSLLSANFLDLRKEVGMINKSDADWLHLDIMDGVFVPNISFGFPVLNALKSICQKPMDVHLMIVEPQKFIPEVAANGHESGCHLESAYAHLLIRRYYPRCGHGFIDVRESGIWWSTFH